MNNICAPTVDCVDGVANSSKANWKKANYANNAPFSLVEFFHEKKNLIFFVFER